MDMDLDAMYDDVRVDEKRFRVYLGFRVYNSFRNFGGFVWFTGWSTFENLEYETLKTKFLKFPNFCFGLQDGLRSGLQKFSRSQKEFKK